MINKQVGKAESGKKHDIFDYLIVILVIYLTDSMLFSLNKNIIFLNFSKIIISLSFLIISVYDLLRLKRINIKLVLGLAIVSLASLSNQIIFGYKLESLFYTMIVILLSYKLHFIISFDSFSKKFVNVMKIISIASLIGYVYTEKFVNWNYFTITTSTRHENFTNLFLTNIPHPTWIQMRNWGPFWEPGVYQIYLIIAILLSYYHKKTWDLEKLLFLITIFTTKSTAAYINIIILFMIVFFTKNNLKLVQKFALFIFLLSVVIVFLNYNNNFNLIFDKMIKIKEEARYLTIIYGLKVFLLHPLTGVGYGNFHMYSREFGIGEVFSITNTWIFLLVSNGFFYFYFYFKNIKRSVKCIFSSNTGVFLSIFYITILFSSQNMYRSLLFNYLVFSYASLPSIYEEEK